LKNTQIPNTTKFRIRTSHQYRKQLDILNAPGSRARNSKIACHNIRKYYHHTSNCRCCVVLVFLRFPNNTCTSCVDLIRVEIIPRIHPSSQFCTHSTMASSVDSTDAKFFVRSFIRFLASQIEQPNFNEDSRESIEVAIQCLENVYELNEEAATEAESSVKKEKENEDPRNHIDLYELYRNTFVVVSPERKQEAEGLKNDGNRLMKEEKYQEALNTYSKAINIDATNPVFYCNRAAAYSRLGDYSRAADDCRMALRHDPDYSKAWGRLGLAYSKMNQHQQAITAYQNAIRLEPDNQDYKNNLSVSQQHLEERSRNPTPGAMPDGLDLGAVLNNPDLVRMAASMMGDPSIQNMLGQLGGMNNMDALLDTGRRLAQQMSSQNPDLFSNVLRQMEEAGVNLPRNNPPNPDGSGNPPQPPPPSSS
uniref:SGTA homodimerisation domain-containing protein n=1 Tax=Anopheles atroparvus TaxID=41427 RepID=A0A182IZV0_ANOAO